MTVPVALFGIWLAAGIGAAIIVYQVLTRPGTIDDQACSRVDDDLNQPSLVGSRLDVVDNLRDCEDQQWAGIEREWHQFLDQFGVRS